MTRIKFIASIVLLFMVAAGPSTGAKPLDYLLQLAGKDLLPEVREAAALALTPALIASNMSNEELHQLARDGTSAELRSSAARALGTRLVQRATGLEALRELAASGEFPEVRAAAGELLSQLLQQSALSLEALSQIVIAGSSSELRMAAVAALTTALANSTYSNEDLLVMAQSGATAEYRWAAAQALVLRLQSARLFSLEQSALFAIVSGSTVELSKSVQGANAQIRTAAAAVFEEQLRRAAWSLGQLEQLAASREATAELRAAVSTVLSEQLLNANLSLEELEQIATGETPELRRAAVPALIQAFVAAVGRRALSQSALIEAVASAPSEEVAEAAAEAVFVLLRSALIAPQAQSQVEAIANGEAVHVADLVIDGSLKAFRVAAGHFLAGLYTFFGFLDRLSDPLGELTSMAEDETLTEELRAAAAQALVLVYSARRGRATQDLVELKALLDQMLQEARQGQMAQALEALARFKGLLDAERALLIGTAEVGGEFTARQLLNGEVNRAVAELERLLRTGSIFQLNAIIRDIRRAFDILERGILRAPDVSTEALEEIAARGETRELRQAASQALAERLWRDLPELSRLMRMAVEGATVELRRAAVPALSAQLIGSGVGLEELYGLALDGATEEVRLAAAQALMQWPTMGNLPLGMLQALADGQSIAIGSLIVDGSMSELRGAFAQVLKRAFIAHDESDEALLRWATGGATEELRGAAAEVLAERFAGPEGPSIESLIELALSPQGKELRAGAAQALGRRLIASELTESDLFKLSARESRLFYPDSEVRLELGHALAVALADRLLRA